jgi:hypothetical protein
MHVVIAGGSLAEPAPFLVAKTGGNQTTSWAAAVLASRLLVRIPPVRRSPISRIQDGEID